MVHDPGMVYENDICYKYRLLIQYPVGLSKNKYKVKGSKTSLPDKYSSKDSIEEFDNFFYTCLHWMHVNNYVGSWKDEVHTDVLGILLKMRALGWFANKVEPVDRTKWDWSFEEIMCTLHKEFIHNISASSVSDKYKATKYSSSEGVLGLYNDMKHYVKKMVMHPNKYTLKKNFIKKIPISLIQPLVKSWRISVEHSTIKVVLNAVKLLEVDFKYLDHLKWSKQISIDTQSNNEEDHVHSSRLSS